MMSQDAYPYLSQLFGAYMHQDWGCEAKDWRDVVRNFTRDDPTTDLRAVAAEVDSLLASHPDDAGLRHQVYRVMRCYYDPRPDLGGPGLREWLVQLGSFLREGG